MVEKGKSYDESEALNANGNVTKFASSRCAADVNCDLRIAIFRADCIVRPSRIKSFAERCSAVAVKIKEKGEKHRCISSPLTGYRQPHRKSPARGSISL